MRIFAALGVMQYHLWQNYFGIGIGHPGTGFFVVLVGAMAAYTQAGRISHGHWWKYISGRYKRLYVTFVPLFVITLLAKWAEADPNWVLKSFLFIPISGQGPVIGSTWMLSMFLLFYFLFSLCFLFRTEKILWGIFGLWLVLIALHYLADWKLRLPQEWSNLFFSERNIQFMMGYLVGMILRHNRLQCYTARLLLWTGFAGLVGGTILLNAGFHDIARSLIVGVPVTLFVLGAATLEQRKVDDRFIKLLTNPYFVWLGGTSYVAYLSHGMSFQIWSRVFPVTVAWTIPMTFGAIIVGALGYAFWENPILTYLNHGKWAWPMLPAIHFDVARKTQAGD